MHAGPNFLYPYFLGKIKDIVCNVLIGFNRWWQHWIEYVNQDQQNNANDGSSLSEHGDLVGPSSPKRPAGIDNSDLIYDPASDDTSMDIEIHDTLLEGRDYVLLPQEVWNQLYSWFVKMSFHFL